jgi:hypothetical protein
MQLRHQQIGKSFFDGLGIAQSIAFAIPHAFGIRMD